MRRGDFWEVQPVSVVLTAPRWIPEKGMRQASPPCAESPLPRKPVTGWEWLGIASLAGLAVFFLAVSWRKWPDPLIDFGRELYVPWRLAHGAVLYRDVDDFYGPLSQYFNAGLFALFGPGLMVLVAANLVVFTAIVAMIYRLFRRAWGAGAAFVSAALFISVFGFSQLVGIGNYNYATPYAHEVTHGLLVCLLLVAVLPGWVENATPRRSLLAGLLFGLAAVLKPEILLAAGLATGAAFLVQRGWRRPWRMAALGAWVLGAVLPTAGFTVYFSTQVPWRAALGFACRAWLSVAASSRFVGDPVQTGFLGFDQPGPHFWAHAGATLVALLVIGAIGGCAWWANRTPQLGGRSLILAVLAAGMVALACWGISWAEVGRCLLGLAVIYGLVCLVTLLRQRETAAGSSTRVLRLLLAVLAVALMGRMLLNGRIYQFGFYQAALAALLVPAVVIGELPARLGVGRWGRVTAIVGCLGLIGPGVVILAGQSRHMLRLKTQAVGEGRDQFTTFSPQLDPTGELIGQSSRWLRTASDGQAQTLLVLPEGEMINYLARLPSPVAPFFFFSAATSGGREAAIVRDLEKSPPDWIVLVSRDLREYGVQRYGESPGTGRPDPGLGGRPL
jgi:hypothetical protein